MTDQSKTDLLPDDFLSLFNVLGAPSVGGQPQFTGVPIGMPPSQQVQQPAAGPVQLPLAHQAQSVVVPQPAPTQAQQAVTPLAAAAPPVAAVTAPQVPLAPVPLPVQPQAAVVPVGQEFALQQQNAQLQAELAQLRQTQSVAAEQAQQQQIAGLPKQEQILAQLEILKRQNADSVQRAQEWQIDSAKKDVVAQYNTEIEPGLLDTSSLQALQASIPTALQAYQVRKSEMFAKFASEMGLSRQVAVEGLPPAPQSSVGFPSTNQAGAVVSLPQGASPQQPISGANHPQMGQDNVYNYLNMGAGRVFQPQQGLPNPQPNAQGNYFPASVAQGVPLPPVHTQAGQVSVPNNAAAYQQAYAQPPAPTPDPGMRADGNSPGRNLLPGERVSAVQAAQAAVAAGRLSGMSGAARLGMMENQANRAALGASGYVNGSVQNLPIPSATDVAEMHPQFLAGARVA